MPDQVDILFLIIGLGSICIACTDPPLTVSGHAPGHHSHSKPNVNSGLNLEHLPLPLSQKLILAPLGSAGSRKSHTLSVKPNRDFNDGSLEQGKVQPHLSLANVIRKEDAGHTSRGNDLGNAPNLEMDHRIMRTEPENSKQPQRPKHENQAQKHARALQAAADLEAFLRSPRNNNHIPMLENDEDNPVKVTHVADYQDKGRQKVPILRATSPMPPAGSTKEPNKQQLDATGSQQNLGHCQFHAHLDGSVFRTTDNKLFVIFDGCKHHIAEVLYDSIFRSRECIQDYNKLTNVCNCMPFSQDSALVSIARSHDDPDVPVYLFYQGVRRRIAKSRYFMTCTFGFNEDVVNPMGEDTLKEIPECGPIITAEDRHRNSESPKLTEINARYCSSLMDSPTKADSHTEGQKTSRIDSRILPIPPKRGGIGAASNSSNVRGRSNQEPAQQDNRRAATQLPDGHRRGSSFKSGRSLESDKQTVLLSDRRQGPVIKYIEPLVHDSANLSGRDHPIVQQHSSNSNEPKPATKHNVEMSAERERALAGRGKPIDPNPSHLKRLSQNSEPPAGPSTDSQGVMSAPFPSRLHHIKAIRVEGMTAKPLLRNPADSPKDLELLKLPKSLKQADSDPARTVKDGIKTNGLLRGLHERATRPDNLALAVVSPGVRPEPAKQRSVQDADNASCRIDRNFDGSLWKNSLSGSNTVYVVFDGCRHAVPDELFGTVFQSDGCAEENAKISDLCTCPALTADASLVRPENSDREDAFLLSNGIRRKIAHRKYFTTCMFGFNNEVASMDAARLANIPDCGEIVAMVDDEATLAHGRDTQRLASECQALLPSSLYPKQSSKQFASRREDHLSDVIAPQATQINRRRENANIDNVPLEATGNNASNCGQPKDATIIKIRLTGWTSDDIDDLLKDLQKLNKPENCKLLSLAVKKFH